VGIYVYKKYRNGAAYAIFALTLAATICSVIIRADAYHMIALDRETYWQIGHVENALWLIIAAGYLFLFKGLVLERN
jgi:hypothetical protein